MLAAQQVINAIATRITGLSLAGSHVDTKRLWPWAEAQLPAWRVVGPDEDVEPLTMHPDPLQAHTLQVELEGTAADATDLVGDLHALEAEALTALFDTTPPADALATIVPSKVQLSLRRMQRGGGSEGQAKVGRTVITLRAQFRTRASAPETLV